MSGGKERRKEVRMRMLVLAAAGLMGLGQSAAVGARSAHASALLRPLSDSDQTATRESGCELVFNAGRKTLIYAIGHDFMLRTRAGRAVCRIGDDEFSALS